MTARTAIVVLIISGCADPQPTPVRVEVSWNSSSSSVSSVSSTASSTASAGGSQSDGAAATASATGPATATSASVGGAGGAGGVGGTGGASGGAGGVGGAEPIYLVCHVTPTPQQIAVNVVCYDGMNLSVPDQIAWENWTKVCNATTPPTEDPPPGTPCVGCFDWVNGYTCQPGTFQ